MGRKEQIVKERKKKLEELKDNDINPYPAKFDKKNEAKELQDKYEELDKDEKTKDNVKVAGRVMIVRDIGKLIFVDLQDSSGQIQLQLQKDETPDEKIDFFKDYVDKGDFIGVEGIMIKTKRGEVTVLVNDLSILSKSLLPLPEKWHGLQDKEEKLRKRYLDLIMNEEARDLFDKKFKFWKAMRDFLIDEGFKEVETPVLETTPGGADAKPFVTYHDALDLDVYLRISMGELWQKRLMVGGFEKTFEIGRQFRNEGMSAEHLQDYSQMEFYWAYANYEDGMKLVEEMYKKVAKEVLGTLKFETHGFEVDLDKDWEKIDYVSEIEKQTGINYFEDGAEDIKKKLEELNIDYEEGVEKARLIDLLWKHCRKSIAGPVFLVNLPVEVSPLAKRKADDERLTERFIVLLGGSEVGNGYSELNDPLDQEERFEKQQKMRDEGDEEAQMHDKDFVEALRYGMPPTCGFGTSERFFAYLVDRPVRECQIFPLMKPKEKGNKSDSQTK